MKLLSLLPTLEKEGSLPARLTGQTPLLEWHRCSEARDLRLIKYGCCSIASSLDLLQQTSFDCTAALSSIRDGPMGHGLGCGDRNFLVWYQRHVVGVFSVEVEFH